MFFYVFVTVIFFGILKTFLNIVMEFLLPVVLTLLPLQFQCSIIIMMPMSKFFTGFYKRVNLVIIIGLKVGYISLFYGFNPIIKSTKDKVEKEVVLLDKIIQNTLVVV